MKYSAILIFAAGIPVLGAGAEPPKPIPNRLIDYPEFRNIVVESAEERRTRRISEKDFLALVSAVRQMGLNSDDGLHGEMRASIHQVEDMLREMRKEILRLVDAAGSGTLMQIMGFSLVLILLMVALIR